MDIGVAMTERIDLGDETQVKTRKQKVKRDLNRKRNTVLAVIATKEGREYLWDLLNLAGVYRTSYAPDQLIYFNEGQRNMGLRILADINSANPEALTVMQREAKEKEAENG